MGASLATPGVGGVGAYQPTSNGALPALPYLLDGGLGDAVLTSAIIMAAILLMGAACAAAIGCCVAPRRGGQCCRDSTGCCCSRSAHRKQRAHEYAAASTYGPEEEEEEEDTEGGEDDGGEDHFDVEGLADVGTGLAHAAEPRDRQNASRRTPKRASSRCRPSWTPSSRPRASPSMVTPRPGDLVMYADPATGLEVPAQVLRVAADGSLSILVEGVGEVEMVD